MAATFAKLRTRDEAQRLAANFVKLPQLPRAATTLIATLIECNTNPLSSSPRHVAPPLNLIAFNHEREVIRNRIRNFKTGSSYGDIADRATDCATVVECNQFQLQDAASPGLSSCRHGKAARVWRGRVSLNPRPADTKTLEFIKR